MDFGDKRGLILSEENFCRVGAPAATPKTGTPPRQSLRPVWWTRSVIALPSKRSRSRSTCPCANVAAGCAAFGRMIWSVFARFMTLRPFDQTSTIFPPCRTRWIRSGTGYRRSPLRPNGLKNCNSAAMAPAPRLPSIWICPTTRPSCWCRLPRPTVAYPKIFLAELLDLNRSRLDEGALIEQKKAIIERAKGALIGTT